MNQTKDPTDRSHKNPWNLMGPSVGSTEDASQLPVSTWRGGAAGSAFNNTSYIEPLTHLTNMQSPGSKFFT